MDSVLDLLSGAVTGLEEHWDNTAELMYLLQEVMKESTD
jgi:hypothetical protein